MDDWDDDDEPPVAVLDNGSLVIKAGLSGEYAPRVTFANLIGHPKSTSMMAGHSIDYYVGEEVLQKCGILVHEHPMTYGKPNWPTDCYDMEKIWRHTFDNELRVCMGDDDEDVDEDVRGVLSTAKPSTSPQDRERQVQVMFENLDVRRFLLEADAVLALHCSGRTTGLVLDSGMATQAVPVCDGHIIAAGVRQLNRGGCDLSNYFCTILMESKITLMTAAERGPGKHMKETLCYVAENFSEEVEAFAGKEKQYEMPDGQVLTVHNQIIRCPQLMLQRAVPWGTATGSAIDVTLRTDEGEHDVSVFVLETVVGAVYRALQLPTHSSPWSMGETAFHQVWQPPLHFSLQS